MNKKILITASIVLIILSISIVFFKLRKRDKKYDNEIQVSVLNAEYKEVIPTIEAYGSIQYKTKADIISLQEGMVTEKKVKEGDYVKKGQILYILKNVELEIQLSQYLNELNSSRANIDLYEAKLEEQKQYVRSALINIENKKIEIEQNEKQLQIQKDLLSKNKEINLLGGLTDQSIIELENQIFTLEANKDILNHQLCISQLGYTADDLISNNITPSNDPETFKNQLIALNTKTCQADLKVANANYENARKNVQLIEKLISDLQIKSPINGIVGATYFETGEHVTKNEKIITVMDISTCIASIPIQESQMPVISSGMNTTIEVPSISKTYSTTISEISPFADPDSGVFYIKANFENPDSSIKPGMFVKCRIDTDTVKTYITIPESSLINTEDNNAECFCIRNNTAIKQNIKINFIRDGTAYIESGIKEGDVIIKSPSKKIKDGTRVKTI